MVAEFPTPSIKSRLIIFTKLTNKILKQKTPTSQQSKLYYTNPSTYAVVIKLCHRPQNYKVFTQVCRLQALTMLDTPLNLISLRLLLTMPHRMHQLKTVVSLPSKERMKQNCDLRKQVNNLDFVTTDVGNGHPKLTRTL